MFCKLSATSDNFKEDISQIIEQINSENSSYYITFSNKKRNILLISLITSEMNFDISGITYPKICSLIKNFSNGTIKFDLSKLTGFHSSFIGILINAKNELSKNNSKLILLNVPEKIRESFRSINLDSFFNFEEQPNFIPPFKAAQYQEKKPNTSWMSRELSPVFS